MVEITEYLVYTCDITSKTETGTNAHGVPIKTNVVVNRKCFIDSFKGNMNFNETNIKIDAVLFLEDQVNIKEGDEVNNVSVDGNIIDTKKYKVVGINPFFNETGLHHIEANLQILG